MRARAVDEYICRGRGKPITPEEIEECAEKYAVGDCVRIRLSQTDHLVGKITAKTKRFLQVTPQSKGHIPKTFLYQDVIMMGDNIQKISEQEMIQLAKTLGRNNKSFLNN